MAVWYCGSVQYAAVAQFAINHAYSIGDIVRQLATPTVGNERCFRCTTAGTSAATEPSWSLTKGATTTSGGAVFTEITGNSTYNWSAPHVRLANALASGWSAAGDTTYVASNHAYTTSASYTITPNIGTLTSPLLVLCVNAAGSVPPVSANITTGASETCTGSANTLMVQNGAAYFQGVSFTAGAGSPVNIQIGAGSGTQNIFKFVNCALSLVGTYAGSFIQLGGVQSDEHTDITLVNTPLTFGATGQGVLITTPGRIRWLNTLNAIGGATFPTKLFLDGSGQGGGVVTLDGVDLSALGSGKTIFGVFSQSIQAFLTNCKLNASVTVASAQTEKGCNIYVINSDSGATGYRQEVHEACGDLTTEIVDVRTGGASDGVQGIAWKVVSKAAANALFPFETFPIAAWNTVTGSSKTATVEIITDGVTLKNDEIWLELEYLGSSATPVSSEADNRKADLLATAASQTTSTAAWTTTGITTPVKQKLQVTFTPQMAGLVRAVVKVAKASQTVWVDPVLTIA